MSIIHSLGKSFCDINSWWTETTNTSHLLHLIGLLGTYSVQLLGGGLKLCLTLEQLPPQVTLPLIRTGSWRQTIFLKPRRNPVELRQHLRTQKSS